MKSIDSIRRALAALALMLPLVASAQMASSNDRVRVVVSIISANQTKDIKGASTDTTMQNKTLSIALTGSSRSPDSRVIKWAAYGRDLKSRTLSTIGFGTIPVALVNNRQTAESKSISTTYTPEHSEVSKSSGRGGGGSSRGRAPKAKKVAASGVKFAGYSVQVLDGGTVVGETSDPVGIKQSVTK